MKFLLVLFFGLLSRAALADGACKVEEPKCLPAAKTETVKKHVVVQSTPQKPDTQDVRQDATAQATTSQHSQTGNQVVSVVVPAPRVVVQKVVRVKKVIKTITYYRPNRLLLILGPSYTENKLTYDGCCSLRVKKEHELDIGVQYLRDFGRVTGSIMGTHNQNFYIGVGVNW